MNYGYIQDTIEDDHYTLGALPPTVLKPSGQWMLQTPEPEVQKRNGVETMNCTMYGTLNCLETLMKHKYGTEGNFSERYGGFMAGTTKEGNSPHKAIEVVRNYAGVIPESDLPFDDTVKTWDDYYSGVTFKHKLKGISFIKEWDIRHEWVLNGDREDWQNVLMENLRYSPLGVAVQAWSKEGDLYVRRGSDTHWCSLVGYVPGKYWIVMDSYDKFTKKLEWDYEFARVKRYHIDRRTSFDTKFVVRAAQGLLGVY